MDSYMRRALPLVSWNEVERQGAFVKMRRGTGEVGWWHDHGDGTDYGGNPMDRSELGGFKCRKCDAIWRPPSGEKR